MTVEEGAFSSKGPEEGYTCRELVYEEDVVLGRSRTEDKLRQREMELPRVRKEDVESAMPCAREG